jgi:signal transduction histidine kinase
MFAVFVLLSTAPLLLLSIYNHQLSEERTQQEVGQTLMESGAILVQRMEELFQSDLDVEEGVSNDFCASLAADQGIEFSVYRGYHVAASSRPEIFESGILGDRLNADVFRRMTILGEKMVIERQSIGLVSYAVGYFEWRVNGQSAGIISIPTIFRQGQIEADLAERNAYILVAYAFALILVLILGWYFSNRITRPVRALTRAAGALGRGEPVQPLSVNRGDEIGVLVKTFDGMVKELDENKKTIARAEREHAWREMAKQVAHEIKNPLTPMKLSVQQLLQSFKDNAHDREKTLERVSSTLLEQIDALSRIASEFSNYARLPNRSYDRIQVSATIEQAAGLFSSVPGISLSLDLAEEDTYVIADEDELRRVFVNLFRNSIQAMEGKGNITVVSEVADKILTIRIEDTGPGIPHDLVEKIFEPNFSTKTEGMGLGLAISRSIIEELGGRISVTQLKNGACFTLVFPLQ